jgi:DNA-binding NtrC family response regulator
MNGMVAGQSGTARGAASVLAGRDVATMRTVVLVSVDAGTREQLRRTLTGLRWQVREASGGAEAMALLEEARTEAMLLDSWLPDLEVGEFAGQLKLLYPAMDVVSMDGGAESGGARSPRRNELLHALREVQGGERLAPAIAVTRGDRVMIGGVSMPLMEEPTRRQEVASVSTSDEGLIAGMVGRSEPMRELARMIRLVAPRTATVLIEGETGTGKEVVAKSLHRLSARASKSFTVLNCAAIPETLLEAELFGHARGAFTGAVQSRVGRIEAADGGTLFLDEIGEMPLALQAKMLRFLESGELQRVGDNELTRVNVRVIAATHQPLEQRSAERLFRLDLYHRLAVFPITVPALRERMEDLPLLIEYFLEQMGHEMPRKRISSAAVAMLAAYTWPGNVRELMHVLERGAILADDRPEIGVDEVRLMGVNRG